MSRVLEFTDVEPDADGVHRGYRVVKRVGIPMLGYGARTSSAPLAAAYLTKFTQIPESRVSLLDGLIGGLWR